MSYCRWSNDSDIYLYHDSCGYMVCCLCQLDTVPTDRKFISREKVIAHLETHLAIGDNIPDYVIQELHDEILVKGDAI